MEVTVRTKRGWVKPSVGAKYAGVSTKVFRRFLTDGLEHSQLPNGRILVRYQAIDTFLEGFQAKDETKQMVKELVESLAE